jgi:hypothetical protein
VIVIERVNRTLRIQFLLEAVLCLYVIAVVVMCWSRPVWAFMLLVAGLCTEFWFWRKKADLAMMVAAGMLGSFSEILCIKEGVWTYDAPGLVFGIPVWIPLVWAYLLCLFRRISISIQSLTQSLWPSSKTHARKRLFSIAGGMIVAYYLMTVAVISKTIALVYTVFMVPVTIFFRGELDILNFLVGATLGPLGEFLCMKLGFWQYHYPFFRSIGIPLSLPLAWGLSTVVIGRIAKLFSVEKGAEGIYAS